MRSRFAITLLLVLTLLVAGCASVPGSLGLPSLPTGQPQPTATVTSPEPTATPASAPATDRTGTAPARSGSNGRSPAAAAPAASQPASTADASAEIKALIEKANQEQQDAFAKGDPTLMKDTATAGYYSEIAQINQEMAQAGVKSIKLLNIEWGPITTSGSNSAQATTNETWRTVYTDGSTEDSRDRNVYTLTLENGAWKIQADDHPDAAQGGTGQSNPGQPTLPTQPTTPAQPTTPSVPNPTPVPGKDTQPASTAPANVTAAVKALIEKANQEQQDAFAKGDPTLMKDTATAGYYSEIAQINQEMAQAGVKSIKLLNIEWGPITTSGSNSAQATTNETWRTVYTDGSTEDSRDRNVYTLTLENGAWKIQADDHPDAAQGGTGQSNPGQPTLPTRPTSPTSPTSPSTTTPSSLDSSHNWSGYAATGGKFTSVTGTWTVPAPKASGQMGVGATWVGIGGTTSRDLIQAGTQETTDGQGRVRYSAWTEILPAASETVPLVISPGDSITVTIAEQSTGVWQVAIKNNTTGKDYSTTIQYSSSYSSAEWVHEAPSSGRALLPIDDFGTITFTNASATKDGKALNLSQSKASPISLINAQGQVLAQPSQITADGKGFSVTRTDAQATSIPTGRNRRGQ